MAVAVGVFVKVILMVFFGEVERCERHHFNHDGVGVLLGEHTQRTPDYRKVVGMSEVDARAVASADVVSLPVEGGGVDGFEEHFEESRQRY